MKNVKILPRWSVVASSVVICLNSKLEIRSLLFTIIEPRIVLIPLLLRNPTRVSPLTWEKSKIVSFFAWPRMSTPILLKQTLSVSFGSITTLDTSSHAGVLFCPPFTVTRSRRAEKRTQPVGDMENDRPTLQRVEENGLNEWEMENGISFVF